MEKSTNYSKEEIVEMKSLINEFKKYFDGEDLIPSLYDFIADRYENQSEEIILHKWHLAAFIISLGKIVIKFDNRGNNIQWYNIILPSTEICLSTKDNNTYIIRTGIKLFNKRRKLKHGIIYSVDEVIEMKSLIAEFDNVFEGKYVSDYIGYLYDYVIQKYEDNKKQKRMLELAFYILSLGKFIIKDRGEFVEHNTAVFILQFNAEFSFFKQLPNESYLFNNNNGIYYFNYCLEKDCLKE